MTKSALEIAVKAFVNAGYPMVFYQGFATFQKKLGSNSWLVVDFIFSDPQRSDICVELTGCWRYNEKVLAEFQDEIAKATAIKNEVIAEIEKAKQNKEEAEERGEDLNKKVDELMEKRGVEND